MNEKCVHGVELDADVKCLACDVGMGPSAEDELDELRRQLADTQQKLTDAQENYRIMADSRQDALRERDEARAEVDRMKADDARVQLIKGDWNQVVTLVEPYPGDFTPTKVEGIIAKLNSVGKILCAGGEDVEERARKVMGELKAAGKTVEAGREFVRKAGVERNGMQDLLGWCLVECKRIRDQERNLGEDCRSGYAGYKLAADHCVKVIERATESPQAFHPEHDSLSLIRQATQSVPGDDLLAKVEGLVKVWGAAKAYTAAHDDEMKWCEKWMFGEESQRDNVLGNHRMAIIVTQGKAEALRLAVDALASPSQESPQAAGGECGNETPDGLVCNLSRGHAGAHKLLKARATWPNTTPSADTAPAKALGATSAASIIKELREAGGKGWDSMEASAPSGAGVATDGGADKPLTLAMKLLGEASEQFADVAPNETWFRDYFTLTGEHMIRTEEGWEPGKGKVTYEAKGRAEDEDFDISDVVHEEVNAPAPSGAESAQVPTQMDSIAAHATPEGRKYIEEVMREAAQGGDGVKMPTVPCSYCGKPVAISPGPAHGLLVNYGAKTCCRDCLVLTLPAPPAAPAASSPVEPTDQREGK